MKDTWTTVRLASHSHVALESRLRDDNRSFIKSILAVFLIFVLSSPPGIPSELPPDLQAQITSFPMGTALEIKLKAGGKVRGRLVAVQAEQFTIIGGRKNHQTEQVIRYREAERVRAQSPTHTPIGAWIAAGALVAVAVIVVAAVLIERHNEGG